MAQGLGGLQNPEPPHFSTKALATPDAVLRDKNQSISSVTHTLWSFFLITSHFICTTRIQVPPQWWRCFQCPREQHFARFRGCFGERGWWHGGWQGGLAGTGDASTPFLHYRRLFSFCVYGGYVFDWMTFSYINFRVFHYFVFWFPDISKRTVYFGADLISIWNILPAGT